MLLPMHSTTNETPHCFAGRSDLDRDPTTKEPILLWSPQAPECRGGLDPSYTHPRTGSHFRDECDFYRACGVETQNKKAEIARQRNFVPTSHLTTPPSSRAFPPTSSVQPSFQPPQFKSVQEVSYQQALQTMTEYQKKLEEAQKAGRAPGPVGAQQVSTNYQAMMPVNYHIPAYLSVPEIHHPDESLLPVLGRELTRGIFKAFGHSLGTFFDNRPWRR